MALRARIGSVLVLLVAVTGCTSTTSPDVASPALTPSVGPSATAEPSATAGPSASGEPGPTPAPTPGGSTDAPSAPAPTPALALSCGDLLSSDRLADALVAPVSALAAVSHRELETSAGPLGAVIRQARGLECEWSNGEPAVVDHAPNPAYVGAVVQLLPDAAEEWSTFTEYYGAEASLENCFAMDSPACEFGTMSEDTWIRLRLHGLSGDDGGPADVDAVSAEAREIARGLRDVVVAAVEGAAPSPSGWTPPSDAAPLGSRCEQFFSPEQLEAALGRTSGTVFLPPDGGYSLEAAAREKAGTTFCLWSPNEDGADSHGSHSWLEGGEWAFRGEVATGAGEPLSVPGLGAGDAAHLTCDDDGTCTLDVLVRRDWVQVTLLRGAAASGTPEAAAVRVAELIASAVRG